MTSLTHISLSACGLAGAVPESWASLQALEYVNLGDNPDLEGPLPATWGQLPRLQYLDLSLLGVVSHALVQCPAAGHALSSWASLCQSCCQHILDWRP